jgi:7-cyano-7-deazaguanine synthase
MPSPSTGLLVSGGLDSSILLKHLVDRGDRVQPFYIRCDLFWQVSELAALRGYLEAVASPRLKPLVVLDLPLADIYGDHWSITGQNVPTEETPDQAVFLPGRNALLALKAALWCQLHGIGELALATLASNPFADASPEFFVDFSSALSRAIPAELRIIQPFGQLHKREVMNLGRSYPLGLTFSCISPVEGQHCGTCNKCAERRAAFRLIAMEDPTEYARNGVLE